MATIKNRKSKKQNIKAVAFVMSCLMLLSFVSYQGLGLSDINEISVYENSDIDYSIKQAVNTEFVTADVDDDTAILKLFGVIPVKKVPITKISTDSIMLGGTPFGIKLFTKGVIVVGLTDIVTSNGAVCPAEKAGIEKGDIITSVNGEEVTSAESFGKLLLKCKGNSVVLRCKRGDSELDVTVSPAVSSEDNRYKVGLWVRDSTAGIGTVTFIDKKSGAFGGLGHGVCDVDTGLLMPLESGMIVDVEVTGVIKGKPQNPGELKGSFNKKTVGYLNSNNETGVFGKVSDVKNAKGELVQIGKKDTVTEGKVYICTTVSGTTPQKYEAEIVKIFKESGKTKNFMIKVTDEKLLETTGGIVQGMSGSPILQNGKLIGAVTHVLINDPEKGYGIFIENMLEQANNTLSAEKDAA